MAGVLLHCVSLVTNDFKPYRESYRAGLLIFGGTSSTHGLTVGNFKFELHPIFSPGQSEYKKLVCYYSDMSKPLSVKRRQGPRFWIFFMLFIALIPMLVAKLGEKIEKAREAEAKTQLYSLLAAEKAFYAEYKEYTSDFAKMGYSPEGKLRCKVILRQEEIMDEQIVSWPEECLPFVNKDSFRASCLMDLGKKTACFSIDEKALFQKFEKNSEATSAK